jgi:hypothetical protein
VTKREGKRKWIKTKHPKTSNIPIAEDRVGRKNWQRRKTALANTPAPHTKRKRGATREMRRRRRTFILGFEVRASIAAGRRARLEEALVISFQPQNS